MRSSALLVAAITSLLPSAGFAEDARAIFQRVARSVVKIEVYSESSDRPVATGSGVAISRNTVATNCHVVKEGRRFAMVTKDQRRAARLQRGNTSLDLCILAYESAAPIPPVKIGRLSNVATGERAFAIGSPLGLENTISEGIVSAIRSIDELKMIQTTAPISPGSSGGGLFNGNGELIGITTFQFRGQNLNFAIPAEYLLDAAAMASIGSIDEPSIQKGNGQQQPRSIAGDQRLSFKGIPLGSSAAVFRKERPNCHLGRTLMRPYVELAMCQNMETFFGHRADLVMFWIIDDSLEKIEVQVPSNNDVLTKIVATATDEYTSQYGSPAETTTTTTPMTTWHYRGDQLQLIRGPTSVRVFLQNPNFDKLFDRVQRKDY